MKWIKKDTDLSLQNIQFKNSINQITAKLRGVTPEEINDDEIRIYRKNMWLKNLTAFTLLLLLFISCLTTCVAVNNQEEAKRQEGVANEQRDSAVHHRKIAEIQRDSANYHQGIAEEQRDSADYQRGIAETQRNIANFQKEVAIGQANRATANYLIGEAEKAKNKNNPFIALRLAEKAWNLDKSNAVYQTILENFYEELQTQNQLGTYLPIPKDFGFVEGKIDKTQVTLDRKKLLTLSHSDGVKIWDTKSKQVLLSIPIDTWISGAKISPFGKYIALFLPNLISVWDIEKREELYTIVTDESPFSQDGNLSSHGNFIKTEGKTLKMWNKEGEIIREFPYKIDEFAPPIFSPNGKYVFVKSKEELHLWDWEKGNIKLIEKLDEEKLSLGFSSNGDKIMSFNSNHLLIWKLDGEKIFEINESSNPIEQAGFSPEGQFIFANFQNRVLRVWNFEHKEIFAHKNTAIPFKTTNFSLRNEYLSLITDKNTIQIWSLDSRGLVEFKRGFESNLETFFPTSNKEIITASGNKITNWNWQKQSIVTIKSDSFKIVKADFSPDNEHVISV